MAILSRSRNTQKHKETNEKIKTNDGSPEYQVTKVRIYGDGYDELKKP